MAEQTSRRKTRNTPDAPLPAQAVVTAQTSAAVHADDERQKEHERQRRGDPDPYIVATPSAKAHRAIVRKTREFRGGRPVRACTVTR